MKLAAFTLLAISAVVLAKPAPAAPAASQKVINPNGDATKCLTASSNSDGATVVIQDCAANSANQLWTDTGSAFQVFGDKCLDDTNGVTTNGQKMQIWTCVSGGSPNQRWSAGASSSIVLSGTTKCLDNTDGKTDNGNPAQIWDCTGGKNQKWSIVDASGSTPPPTNGGKTVRPGKSSNTCLTATSTADNAAVVVQPCGSDSAATQEWTVVNGNLQIFGDKCLDVPNGSTANGQKMQIFTCFSGNTNQLFTVTGDNRIAWTNKGECLDLTDGITSTGNAVQMWKCTDNNSNQVWNFV